MDVFKLNKAIEFEGITYESFDLSGLEDLSGEEYASLLKQAEKIDGESMVPEKSLTFAFLAAAKVTGKPYDLFFHLKGKDASKLRYNIGSFFLAED